MAEASARSEKLTDILTGRIGQGLKQFLGTTGLALLGTWSPWLVLAGIPALMLVDQVVQARREHNLYRSIRQTYADELCALAHIPTNELTTDKTKELIQAHRDDPRFLPFQEMVNLYDKGARRNLLQSFVAAVITSGVICLASHLGRPIVEITMYTGTTTALLFDAMREIFNSDMQEAAARSVSTVIRELSGQAMGQKVEPAKIMQVFMKARPALQEEVRQYFGKSFDEMSLGEKNRVVALYDEALHLSELATKINQGVIRPTEISWIALGQRSGVPEKPAPAANLTISTPYEAQRADFVARLEESRSAEKAALPTLH